MRAYLLLATAILASGAAVRAPAPAKKLIEFGWDEPDTAFMRAHAREMRATPFDGCVFHAGYPKPGGGSGSFTWECWGTRAFTAAELAPAVADLRAADLGRFRENFLRFNVTPGKLDWFDDFSAVIANARLAADTARKGRCRGLLFDIEQYETKLWRYPAQKDATTKSWEVYSSQVRQRGREVMRALQSGYPCLTIFLTFGYSLPWVQSRKGTALAEADYGLLKPFLDGMVEAAEGRTKIIEGNELAYGYRTEEQFAAGDRLIRDEVMPIVADPRKYGRVFRMAYGLWMDRNWRTLGWDTADSSKNYFTPAAWEQSLRRALQLTDEYVWVYTETPRWWTAGGGPEKLPAEYAAATRAAAERLK